MLILDINMPILSGYETCKQVKKLFKVHNETWQQTKPTVMRPLICFLSQQPSVMTQLFVDDEQAEIFLEKPLAKNELSALAQIIDLC